MKKKRVLYFVSVILLLVIGYFYYVNRSSYINSKTWRYSDGAYFGDLLYLSDNTNKNDKVNWKVLFCYGETLLVKNNDTKEIGYYNKIILNNSDDTD